MDDDGLTDADVKRIAMVGKIVAALTDDPRGVRYVVRGRRKNSKGEVEIVCRFLPSSTLRIITVYGIEE
jgi:hypothetical protein